MLNVYSLNQMLSCPKIVLSAFEGYIYPVTMYTHAHSVVCKKLDASAYIGRLRKRLIFELLQRVDNSSTNDVMSTLSEIMRNDSVTCL